jgi:hypothetical protein
MSLWEFNAAIDGYQAAHNPKGKGQGLTDEESDTLDKVLDEYHGN